LNEAGHGTIFYGSLSMYFFSSLVTQTADTPQRALVLYTPYSLFFIFSNYEQGTLPNIILNFYF
jgi:hypothetical protein